MAKVVPEYFSESSSDKEVAQSNTVKLSKPGGSRKWSRFWKIMEPKAHGVTRRGPADLLHLQMEQKVPRKNDADYPAQLQWRVPSNITVMPPIIVNTTINILNLV